LRSKDSIKKIDKGIKSRRKRYSRNKDTFLYFVAFQHY